MQRYLPEKLKFEFNPDQVLILLKDSEIIETMKSDSYEVECFYDAINILSNHHNSQENLEKKKNITKFFIQHIPDFLGCRDEFDRNAVAHAVCQFSDDKEFIKFILKIYAEKGIDLEKLENHTREEKECRSTCFKILKNRFKDSDEFLKYFQ